MKITVKKLIWLILPFLIVAILWFKWDNWFFNPPEPAYSPSSTPSRIMLTWSGNSLHSRDVTWEGDTAAHQGTLQITANSLKSDTIIYRTASKIIKTSGGASAFYKVGIVNLREGETYRYRVATGSNWSKWSDFKTSTDKDSTYSFIYIGDVQLSHMSWFITASTDRVEQHLNLHRPRTCT